MPWAVLGATNADVIASSRPMLVRVIIERLCLLAYFELRSESPLELVQQGLTDPVKLFTKGEPHSETKLAEGRLRQISSVSIVGNTLSRLLFGRQNRKEKSEWQNGTIPSMCGMGSSDDDLKYLHSVWRQQGLPNLAEADVSGWDWSVQAWELSADVDRRVQLMGAGSNMARLMHNLVYTMANKVFQLSDGSLISQVLPGVLPSGWYCTTTTNSYIRALNADLVGAEFYRVLGDDSVESYVEGAKEKYLALGKRVKFYNRCDTSVEFCSRKWTTDEWQAQLTSWPRTLYRLLSQSAPSPELERQFSYELRHNEGLPYLKEVLLSVGWHGQNHQASHASEEDYETDDGTAKSPVPTGQGC